MHRLNLVAVDEIGDAGDHDIEREDHPHQIEIGLFLPHQSSHHVRASGGAAVLQRQCRQQTADGAGGDGRQNGAGAVVGHIGKLGKVHLFQQQNGGGEHDGIHALQ